MRLPYEYPVNLVIEGEKQYNKEYTFSCKEIKIEKEYGLTSFTAFYNRKFSDPIELDIKNKDGYELPQYKGSAQLLFKNMKLPEKSLFIDTKIEKCRSNVGVDGI